MTVECQWDDKSDGSGKCWECNRRKTSDAAGRWRQMECHRRRRNALNTLTEEFEALPKTRQTENYVIDRGRL